MTKEQQTDFGFKKVDASKKASLVRGVFDSVASKYDIMNDFMSAGTHRLWKDHFAKQVKLFDGMKILDLAGGTGDITLRLLKRAKQMGIKIHVTVSDINDAMLEEGRKRFMNKGIVDGVAWQQADAEKLPFKANEFDAVTMAFGIRNVTNKNKALNDIYRVLKKPGQFACLEFSPVEDPLIKPLYDAYSFHLVPLMGQLVAGDRESYQYLVESIRQFPNRGDFAAMLEKAKFISVRYEALSLGVVLIHQGWKN